MDNLLNSLIVYLEYSEKLKESKDNFKLGNGSFDVIKINEFLLEKYKMEFKKNLDKYILEVLKEQFEKP